jgi:hypothetical protein
MLAPIFVPCAPNLLHHNNVGVTFAETSNFKMELIRYVPLYYVTMFQFLVIVTKTPFITALGHTIVGMRCRPLTSRGTKSVNVHTEMLREVNKIFDNLPSNLGGGGLSPLGPLGPSRYFGLSMVNPSKPPLPPNMLYRRPLNYLEYAKDSNLNAHARVFKVVEVKHFCNQS